MQVTFSGIGGRTALVPQKNGVRTPSWAFNSNLKFTCKMSMDTMQDVRVTETPITRPLIWEDEQPAPATVAGNMNYTANATATLTGLPVPVINLKTCNGAPGQFKNGFYFGVTSETHGKCLLVAYLHLGGLLVRPSVKSFNKNNAVLVHTEMCSYDTHSVSVDIKIPETSSIHKAGPRYSSTHPPFCIKFILWGQDGLIKTMHESMPLYSYAKDPDQVNCQYFSPNPSAPLPSPSTNTTTTPTRERNSHRGTHESPPPSPPPLTATNLLAATPANTSPTTSPTNHLISSPLASLNLLGSTAAAISIPMDSFKSLVAYIQKLERQVELQQQQLEAARQQEELQHRIMSQLAQDIKFKSFQCEVLEEKMQQLSSTHPTHSTHTAHASHTSHTAHPAHTTHSTHPTHTTHTTAQTPTGDNLITSNHLLSLNPIMNASASTNTNLLSPFAYSTTPSTASTTASSTHIPSTNSNNALPSFSYPTTTTAHSSSLTPINSFAAPLLLNPLTTTLTTLTTPSTTITTPTAATESTMSTTTTKTAELTTTTSTTTISTVPTPTPTLAHTLPHTASTADTTHVVPEAHAEVHPTQEQHAAHAPTHVPSTASIASVVSAVSGVMSGEAGMAPVSGTEQGRTAEPPKAETQEQEVRDFLTQMQKKQKQDGLEAAESEVEAKRQRT